MSEIADFYTGKNVIITGGTGFIGKVLIVKLLTACSNISGIYLMLREKNGVSPENRIKEIVNTAAFNDIRENKPELLKKLKIIKCSFEEDGLGLSDKDREDIIENCHIVLHIAADVHFITQLHDIFVSNVFGVHNLMNFLKKMKNLKSFIFCSTTFSQNHKIILKEDYHPPRFEPEFIHKLLNKYDAHTINILTAKILKDHANTYSFSKALAEHIVYNSDCKFPIAIARPSIVSGSAIEPMPGWTEGYHGVNGFIVASSRGVLKTMVCSHYNTAPLIPVDVVANTLAILGWKTATAKPDKIEYYNIASNHGRTWAQIIDDGQSQARVVPLDYSLLRVGGTFKVNRFYNSICALWMHVLPALLVDFLLILFLKKPRMIEIRKKIDQGTMLLAPYLINNFKFKTDKFKKLIENLNEVDRKIYFINGGPLLRSENYIKNIMTGVKTYILREKMENLPKAKRFAKILDILTVIFYSILAYLVTSFVYRRKDFFINFFIPQAFPE